MSKLKISSVENNNFTHNKILCFAFELKKMVEFYYEIPYFVTSFCGQVFTIVGLCHKFSMRKIVDESPDSKFSTSALDSLNIEEKNVKVAQCYLRASFLKSLRHKHVFKTSL